MEASFWHRKWENNEIGFHEGVPNDLLVKHFGKLGLAPGSRVFVPLCGKSRDLAWLLAQGFRVAGAELSELAVRQWFEESGIEPTVRDIGKLRLYSGPDVDILAGDVFELSGESLGGIDAIYDRAALVALPADTRRRYTAHLRALGGDAPQFLICFLYDQALMDGPPFSIDDEEVRAHYGDAYQLTLCEVRDVPGGLKGQCAAQEKAWLLQPL
jgi:thiopurine S-methyltransferase